MALNSSVESQNPTASSETTAKKSTTSKPIKTKTTDIEVTRSIKNAAIKLRLRSKTIDSTDLREHKRSCDRPTSADYALNNALLTLGKSETSITKNLTEGVQEEDQDQTVISIHRDSSSISLKSQPNGKEMQKKVLIYENPSETYSKLYREHGSSVNGKTTRQDSAAGKPSEISKVKVLKKKSTRNTTPSKLPVKISQKEGEPVQLDMEQLKTNGVKGKKDPKEDKVKNALKENFSTLVPLYEHELKNITDTWVNAIYCSLTMRAHLARLLYKAIPSLNKAQFHLEDETLLHNIARAKSYTKAEAENLMQFIRLLLLNRNKARDDYMVMLTNKQIAESYNHNWKALTKKIADLGEETKQLQLDIPALEKKRDSYEMCANDKIRKMESNLCKKEEEIKKLANQLNMLRYRENSYKGNISLKIEDFKDIKEEVVSLKCVEKEFEELKAKYMCQNDIFEKKIKDLENLLEEKKKTLKKEKDLKKQLQSFLLQLHTHERNMCRKIGKEQVDFVMGRSTNGKSKRREQLWASAIKLVLKGFLVQIRKLERDRNKMLLELNSNDLVNYNSLATAIIQKDNFIKSIKHQMNTFNVASKCTAVKNSETSIH